MRARVARLALRAYPRPYREVHEDEMVATLLDLEEGGRAAGLVALLNLVAHGTRVRVRSPREVVGGAGAVGLLVAAALMATMLLGTRAPSEHFGGVPWLSQVATPKYVATQVSPVPTRLPRPRAACPASWLTASAGPGVGGGMESTVWITLRNDGPETCALTGTPSVVAYGPGGVVRVAATRPFPPPLWGGPSVDGAGIAAPHHSIFVELFIGDWCGAMGRRPESTFPTYDDLVLSRPGGWSIQVATRPFTISSCFFITSRFASLLAPPTTPVLPFDRLYPRLRLPHTFTPGSTLVYDVVLHNPTSRAIALLPCPAYLVTAISGHFRLSGWYLLNCGLDRAVPPHSAVTFLMKLRVSPRATARALYLSWQLNSAEVCDPWSDDGRCGLRVRGLVRAG